MARYLITGGAGFIGSNIATELAARGESVRVLDDFSSGRIENLADIADRIEIIRGDIRSYHTVRRAVAGVDYVLHQAAVASVPFSVEDPITANEINLSGTLNVLYAAREAGVKRLVYASSSAVYGNAPEQPKRETMAPQPMSPYAIAKLAGERYCRTFYQLYGFETVALRYFNVFGPRQDPASAYAAVIPLFTAALLAGKPITIHGDGQQSRDFVFVKDVAEANLLACTAPGAAGGVFNIAGGQRRTLLELVDNLAAVTGREPHLEYTPPRPGDVPHSQADISLAEKSIGYRPAVDLPAGLVHTVACFLGGKINPENKSLFLGEQFFEITDATKNNS